MAAYIVITQTRDLRGVTSQASATSETPGAGRAKLRLSRGFLLGLAPKTSPKKFSPGLFHHFTPYEQISASRIFRFHAKWPRIS
jgi:hypothetical protein